MKFLIVALALSASFSSFAVDCQNTVIQPEMNECARQSFLKEDAKLNTAYKNLMKFVDAESGDRLKKAQRAWIAFRDTNCEFDSDIMRGGQAEPMLMFGCMEGMTMTRTEELKQSLKDRQILMGN